MSKLNEEMNRSAIFQVFRIASGEGNTGEYEKILAEWKKVKNTITGPQELGDFLRAQGCQEDAIRGAINEVFGNEDDSDGEPSGNKTHAILKIAAFAKKNGHAEELINYMRDAYGDELGLNKPEGFASRAKNFAKNIFKEDVQLGRSKKTSLVIEATVNDVLRIDQYVKIMSLIKPEIHSELGAVRTKGRIMESWQKGNRSRKHYGDLLGKIDININDLIDK